MESAMNVKAVVVVVVHPVRHVADAVTVCIMSDR